MSERARGFILQPTYRVEGGRPVVHLYGRLEEGGTFLIRDDRPRPHFYVGQSDAERVRQLTAPAGSGGGAAQVRPSGRINMSGHPVSRVEVPTPADAPPLRDRLQRAAIPCYEADVRFAMRYLIDRGIRSSLAIEGSWTAGERVDRIYQRPELFAADWTPRPRVLSIDLETDPTARNILSAALCGDKLAQVLLLTSERHESPEDSIPVHSQRELIEELCRRIRRFDPDIITGWNVVDFDFRVLLRRANEVGARIDLGRRDLARRDLGREPEHRGDTRLIAGRGLRQASRVVIPGRLVLDGLQLVRSSFVKLERYSLEAVAREILGRGKDLGGSGRAQTILQWFRHERQRLVDYNLKDAQLVLDILERLELIELTVERSKLTGMPLDRVSSSVASFDFLYLSQLHRRGIVAPIVQDREPEPMPGGHVLEPQPGLHHNVLSFDFKSLYPSIVRTFQIDPLGLVDRATAKNQALDLIEAPNGAAFRRQRGVLTEILDQLFPRRDAAKRAGRMAESNAIKLLMNSLYGVLGTTVSRFYDPRLAGAITGFGKKLLLWSKSYVEARGLRVLYGDTDSLFVEAQVADPETALERGQALAQELTADLASYIEQQWQVPSRLELELERLYLRLFLPSLRHSNAGAMKRYAGLAYRPGRAVDNDRELVFVGLESVRRDWTELAKRAQRKLFEQLFTDAAVVEPLRELVARLRRGELDELLTYRKGLRKPLDEYTATTPPHVAAARKSTRPIGRVVEYVMTVAGPELASERQSELDYEHYVDRQLRPIAEPILEHLGLEFAKVIGDDRQIDLWEEV